MNVCETRLSASKFTEAFYDRAAAPKVIQLKSRPGFERSPWHRRNKKMFYYENDYGAVDWFSRLRSRFFFHTRYLEQIHFFGSVMGNVRWCWPSDNSTLRVGFSGFRFHSGGSANQSLDALRWSQIHLPSAITRAFQSAPDNHRHTSKMRYLRGQNTRSFRAINFHFTHVRWE